MLMEFPYDDIVASSGERLTLTNSDASKAASMRGVYDLRYIVGEIAGADTAVPDYRVGVVARDLPSWVTIDCRVDIRGDALSIVRLEPDGQGLMYLVCRRAP